MTAKKPTTHLTLREEVFALIDGISPWSRDGKRAPHKALLFLTALGLYLNRNIIKIKFSDIEAQLDSAIAEFGGSTGKSNQPFWHLQSDGVWMVSGIQPPANMKYTATKTALRHENVYGQLSERLLDLFASDYALVFFAIARTLSNHFTGGLYRTVCNSCGISGFDSYFFLDMLDQKRSRSASFRVEILNAYHYKCAFCGHSLMLAGRSVGLEAAHIKWFCFDGPDLLQNGIAFCATHHVMFDYGAFTLDESMQILVSEKVKAPEQDKSYLHQRLNSPLYLPSSKSDWPSQEFLNWHRKQVFRA